MPAALDIFGLELQGSSVYTGHVRRYGLTTMPHAITEETESEQKLGAPPCPSMVSSVLRLRGNSPAASHLHLPLLAVRGTRSPVRKMVIPRQQTGSR